MLEFNRMPRTIRDRSPFAASVGGTIYRKRRKGVVDIGRSCFRKYSTTSGGGDASIGKILRTFASEALSRVDQCLAKSPVCWSTGTGRPSSGRRAGSNIGGCVLSQPVANTAASQGKVCPLERLTDFPTSEDTDAR